MLYSQRFYSSVSEAFDVDGKTASETFNSFVQSIRSFSITTLAPNRIHATLLNVSIYMRDSLHKSRVESSSASSTMNLGIIKKELRCEY
jgi:hypothetical protein